MATKKELKAQLKVAATLLGEPDEEVEAEVVFGCHTEVADDEYEPVFGFAGGAQCHTE